MLQKISILTNDRGPAFDDVALALFFSEVIIVLPSKHDCYSKMYDDISRNLALNYQSVIDAMSCAENAEFVIWTK